MIIFPLFLFFLSLSSYSTLISFAFGKINYENKSKRHPRLPTPLVYRWIIPIKEERQSWSANIVLPPSSTYSSRHERTIPHNYILIDSVMDVDSPKANVYDHRATSWK